MTNADVIRAMSDEELYTFLSGWELGDYDYSITFCDLCMKDKRLGGEGNAMNFDCDGCRKYWLTKEDSEMPKGRAQLQKNADVTRHTSSKYRRLTEK